ncbi:acyl-CoA synthetase FdrA [Streptomyces sp. NPDC050658]|uniref:acyl-CoA synthetase FdrA n=1 Tax=unclassified Streptomyces TaxID=2593676 RepID=UPI00343C1DE2
MVLRNAVHKDLYADSVALMRVAARLAERPGVLTASLVMGTPANREVLDRAGLLTDEGRAAGPNDLIVAVSCPQERGVADAALSEALTALSEATGPEPGRPEGDVPLRSLAGAPADADLALISTPGAYATAEALKALRRGLHAFVFSDHVPVADELMLKQEAAGRGLLVMGPDCGTSLIDGIPLGFANSVRRGGVGLAGASGTGLQQVSCLLHAMGAGVSHLIGTGSRDLSAEIGGRTMLGALDALAADPATEVVVLVSKPPAPEVAARVLDRAAGIGKPVIACFLGWEGTAPAGVTLTRTLREAARAAAVHTLGRTVPDEPLPEPPAPRAPRRWVRGLYAGGTFAYEARSLLGPALGDIARDAPGYIPGEAPRLPARHLVLDLGDDAYTAGRPHPMIDPAVRTAYLRAALDDASTAVVLLDVVLGHGAADDPAGEVARVLAEGRAERPVVIAFVVGTDRDMQQLALQKRMLEEAGAVVVDSGTVAAQVTARLLTRVAEPAGATRIGGGL